MIELHKRLELSDWYFELCGVEIHNTPKGKEPNAFQRRMHLIFFGMKWKRKKVRRRSWLTRKRVLWRIIRKHPTYWDSPGCSLCNLKKKLSS